MKKALSICMLFALLSCNKQDLLVGELLPSFNKNLIFTYEGQTYSSNYSMNNEETFEWENAEIGGLYESILASGPVIQLIGDTANILIGKEAEAVKAEHESNLKLPGKEGIGTKAQEITAFRFSAYRRIDFDSQIKNNVIIKDVEKEEHDIYSYYIGAYLNSSIDPREWEVPKSLSFVVLRQGENSFYPKYNARLTLRTHFTPNTVSGKETQENYLVLDTRDLGFSIKIPDLREFGFSNPGRLGSRTDCSVSVF